MLQASVHAEIYTREIVGSVRCVEGTGVPVLEVGRFARLERDDGGDRTLLRCKVTLSRSSDAWTTPRFSILTDTDVLVLRMNAPNEQGFAYVRMPNGQEGFVQLKYLVPHYPVQ